MKRSQVEADSKIQHIDYALVARGHSPMYVMHKFWARKPHNVVSEYIKKYSRPGQIILDPFLGSGVTALEAVKLGRRAVGIDLNPMAVFIAEMTGAPADLSSLKSSFDELARKCREDIQSYYKTTCLKCGRMGSALATIWKRIDDKPTEIRYFCPFCKKKLKKAPDKADQRALRKLLAKPIKTWYPKDEFPRGITFDQGRREAGKHFSDLFTKRNLRALSVLWKVILDVVPKSDQPFFTFAFTSMLHLASKMTPVRPTRPFSSFWAINSYWVPPVFMESNVWMLFESAVIGRQGLLSAKEDSNSTIRTWMPAKSFSDLENGSNIFLKVHNSLELDDILPESCVDYVFTDPPYGGAVPYAELCTLWSIWKGFKTNYKDEITINDEKSFDYYHKMLNAAFRQVFRVLKPSRYLTVTFHSTDIRVWNSIINAVILAGFDLEKIIYQPPARPSAKGLLVPYGSAVGDYYIRFRKPERASPRIHTDVTEDQYNRAVVEAAKKILAERGEPTAYAFILNGIIVELRKAGVLLAGRKNPDRVMRDRLDIDFELVEDRDATTGRVLGRRWWFRHPSAVAHLDIVPLADRLETAIVSVLHRHVKVSFDEVLQEIFVNFPNSLTPETQKVRGLLEEYADQTSDGKWALKPIVHAREGEHSRIIYILALLGKKAGFQVSIGSREQGEVYAGKKLIEYASRRGPNLESLPAASASRVKQIDLLWFQKNRIVAAFEVENTTAITEAIVRGANLSGGKVKRFIVLPEEREKLLYRKLQEPMLRERVSMDLWQFIFYRDLSSLFEDAKRKKTLALTDILKIAATPKLKNSQLGLQFDS